MAEGTGSAALLRQLDRYLAGLRPHRDPDELELATHLAAALRRLVVETATASAADRARVRAAVHYVALRRGTPRGPPPSPSAPHRASRSRRRTFAAGHSASVIP